MNTKRMILCTLILANFSGAIFAEKTDATPEKLPLYSRAWNSTKNGTGNCIAFVGTPLAYIASKILSDETMKAAFLGTRFSNKNMFQAAGTALVIFAAYKAYEYATSDEENDEDDETIIVS